uniref:Uncharacterized protein n=1 Tax=Vannella robusta TaxID=1487602 RepID=A0A7S4MPX4_9EUKA|mmetsp:Transcript_6356/g.7816  ORF Transcript_6356/g.7816 Transcript_6356/m.7816 type:complete len:107 (+) Transcript_6356:1338-1658(+)
MESQRLFQERSCTGVNPQLCPHLVLRLSNITRNNLKQMKMDYKRISGDKQQPKNHVSICGSDSIVCEGRKRFEPFGGTFVSYSTRQAIYKEVQTNQHRQLYVMISI